MDRPKMSRQDRAKQFAPFDALKGLQEALKIKEYEHDKIVKGDLLEDEVKEISSVLAEIEKNDIVKVEFFQDGHNVLLVGKARIDVEKQKLYVGSFEISFDMIKNLKKQ